MNDNLIGNDLDNYFTFEVEMIFSNWCESDVYNLNNAFERKLLLILKWMIKLKMMI